MANDGFFGALAKAGGVLGKGLIAGFAGTVAITISQMIEMKIRDREGSNTPAIVGGKTLGVEPRGEAELERVKDTRGKAAAPVKERAESNEARFGQLIHFGYGTGWGVFRSSLDLAGIRGPIADALHFSAIYGTAQVMLPTTAGTPPVHKQPTTEIISGIIHHAVYACAAGCVYDLMSSAEEQKKTTALDSLKGLLKSS